MKYKETCPCCGRSEVAYVYRLNKGKIAALAKLVEVYNQERRPLQMKEIGLTNPQYTNFAHLQYWELAKLIPAPHHGWIPTPEGVMFLKGEIPIYDIVAVMGKEIMPHTHSAWETHTRLPKLVRVYDIDETRYQQKKEFQDQKSNQRILF